MGSCRPDVVIVGGGIAGCATAIALKRFVPELNVCILNQSGDSIEDAETKDKAYTDNIRPRIGETLPPQVAIPLQQLGIWERFSNASFIESAGTFVVWGEDQPHVNEYIYSPFGNGWHLDRRQFDGLMVEIAKQQDVELFYPCKIIDIRQRSDGWRLQVRTTKQSSEMSEFSTVSARFVVDATGRSARIAQRLGATKHIFDSLVGIYRFYQQNDDAKPIGSDSSTLIESVDEGWWYSARLPRHRQVVALMTDADLARSKGYRQNAQFKQAIEKTQHITRRLAGLTASGAPIVTAAHTQCLDDCAGANWLAVGDAAFTYDPLSSLGIFMALRMSIHASYAIKDFFKSKDRNLVKYQWLARAEFNNYLAKRRQYYAEETRFSNKPFWQRRSSA